MHDNGWKIVDCYVDDGYSGTNYNRPGFQRMIDDIEAGKICGFTSRYNEKGKRHFGSQ